MQVILLNQPLVGWNYLYQFTFLFKFTPLNISYKKQVITAGMFRCSKQTSDFPRTGFLLGQIIADLIYLFNLVSFADNKICFISVIILKVIYITLQRLIPSKKFYKNDGLQSPAKILAHHSILPTIHKSHIYGIYLLIAYS